MKPEKCAWKVQKVNFLGVVMGQGKIEIEENKVVGVLSIKCKDNMQRPVAYISKSLNETEQNYEIHNKEMLAVIQCLEVWRHFLEGTRSKFKVWMDHKNLKYFMSNQKLNCQQV